MKDFTRVTHCTTKVLVTKGTHSGINLNLIAVVFSTKSSEEYCPHQQLHKKKVSTCHSVIKITLT